MAPLSACNSPVLTLTKVEGNTRPRGVGVAGPAESVSDSEGHLAISGAGVAALGRCPQCSASPLVGTWRLQLSGALAGLSGSLHPGLRLRGAPGGSAPLGAFLTVPKLAPSGQKGGKC